MFGQKVDQESMIEQLMVSDIQLAEQHFFSALCERKAEITVCKKQLEVRMMRIALDLIRREHSALLAAFD
jgi:signal transduction histidine kinase